MTAPRLRLFEGANQPFDERGPALMARTMAQWCNDASKISAYVNNFYGGKRVTREQCAALIHQRQNVRTRKVPEWTEKELAEAAPKLVLVPEAPPLPEPDPNATVIERAQAFRAEPFDLRALIRNVADALDMTHGEIIGDCRQARFIDARAVVVKVLQARGWSYPKQARAIGRKDHSTTINLCAKFDIYARRNPKVAELFELYRP